MQIQMCSGQMFYEEQMGWSDGLGHIFKELVESGFSAPAFRLIVSTTT